MLHEEWRWPPLEERNDSSKRVWSYKMTPLLSDCTQRNTCSQKQMFGIPASPDSALRWSGPPWQMVSPYQCFSMLFKPIISTAILISQSMFKLFWYFFLPALKKWIKVTSNRQAATSGCSLLNLKHLLWKRLLWKGSHFNHSSYSPTTKNEFSFNLMLIYTFTTSSSSTRLSQSVHKLYFFSTMSHTLAWAWFVG